MIGNFLVVLNFNGFICNQLQVLPDHRCAFVHGPKEYNHEMSRTEFASVAASHGCILGVHMNERTLFNYVMTIMIFSSHSL